MSTEVFTKNVLDFKPMIKDWHSWMYTLSICDLKPLRFLESLITEDFSQEKTCEFVEKLSKGIFLNQAKIKKYKLSDDFLIQYFKHERITFCIHCGHRFRRGLVRKFHQEEIVECEYCKMNSWKYIPDLDNVLCFRKKSYIKTYLKILQIGKNLNPIVLKYAAQHRALKEIRDYLDSSEHDKIHEEISRNKISELHTVLIKNTRSLALIE